jgi:predicted dehydrogenase
MNEGKIRVAVVGLGFGAEFVPIYLDHPDVRSVAVYDADPERLCRGGGRFGIKKQFKDEVMDHSSRADEVFGQHRCSRR